MTKFLVLAVLNNDNNRQGTKECDNDFIRFQFIVPFFSQLESLAFPLTIFRDDTPAYITQDFQDVIRKISFTSLFPILRRRSRKKVLCDAVERHEIKNELDSYEPYGNYPL